MSIILLFSDSDKKIFTKTANHGFGEDFFDCLKRREVLHKHIILGSKWVSNFNNSNLILEVPMMINKNYTDVQRGDIYYADLNPVVDHFSTRPYIKQQKILAKEEPLR